MIKYHHYDYYTQQTFQVLIISEYQRMEYASGSKLSIPEVNEKYGSALNDKGIITSTGMIKKRRIKPQITRKA